MTTKSLPSIPSRPARYALSCLFSLTLLLLPAVGQTQNGNPIPGFNYLGTFNTTHYYRSTSFFTWPNANTHAQAQGGHLVSIHSQSENDFLLANIYRFATSDPYIGLNDYAQEGVFVWSSGEPVTFTKWQPGEPNGGVTSGGVEFWSIGTWNDVMNGNTRNYILEFSGVTCPGPDLYVDASVASSGNGASWATAFQTLAEALKVAHECPDVERVHVAQGTYYPAYKPFGMAIGRTGTEIVTASDRDKTFHIRAGLEVYGGYPTGGGTRDVAANPTTLSGDLGMLNTLTDNAYHVVLMDTSANWAVANDACVLEGFTVTLGYSNNSFSTSGPVVNGETTSLGLGAGVYIVSGTHRLANNTITENTTNRGAGIGSWYLGSVPGRTIHLLVQGNTIRNNHATLAANPRGGAMYLGAAAATLTDNTIHDNNAGNGGAIYTISSVATLQNNTFFNNTAVQSGGALYLQSGMTLINNVIHNNTAGQNGGGVFLSGDNTLINNTIHSNEAGSGFFGGGVYISGNSALNNNIFAANNIAGNTGVAGADFYSSLFGTPTFRHNLLQRTAGDYTMTGGGNYDLGTAAVGNLFGLNPLFVAAGDIDGPNNIHRTADDGLALQLASPVRNQGSNSLVPAEVTTDITGADRIVGTSVDMGAYEQPTVCPEFSAAPGKVIINNGICGAQCQPVGAGISAPTTGCPDGSTLQYSVNNGAWSNSLPMYAALSYADTIKTRCVCDADALVTSPVSDGVPVGECTDNTLPMATCSNSTVTFNGQESIALNAATLVSASDNCGIQSIALSPTSILATQVGQTVPVTVTVTDVNNLVATCTAYVSVTGLPSGWSQTPDGVGCADGNNIAYNTGTGVWTATSTNCYYASPFTADETAFAQRTLCGNGSITALVTGINLLANGWAGIMMRESNAPGAKKAQLMTNLSNLSRREFRIAANAAAQPQQFPSQNRYWLRITRAGNQFSMYVSPNGMAWYLVGTQNIVMSNCIQMGLVATNYTANSTVTATFSNVSFTGSNIAVAATTQGVARAASLDQQHSFEVYPNPTSGDLNVDLTQYIGRSVRIEVYSLEGKLVQFNEIDEVQTTVEQMNLSDHHSGMYLMKVKSDGLPDATRRVVKQ